MHCLRCLPVPFYSMWRATNLSLNASSPSYCSLQVACTPQQVKLMTCCPAQLTRHATSFCSSLHRRVRADHTSAVQLVQVRSANRCELRSQPRGYACSMGTTQCLPFASNKTPTCTWSCTTTIALVTTPTMSCTLLFCPLWVSVTVRLTVTAIERQRRFFCARRRPQVGLLLC
jgi:hypothetical protein